MICIRHVNQGAERASLPDRRRRADGPARAPALAAGLPGGGGRRSATASRCAPACWARTWWCSATATAASACWASTARTAARRWCSAATRTAACAACTTAGSSTWKATWSTCPPKRRAPPSAWARRPRPIRRAKAAASSGSGWARATKCASSSRRPGRRSPAIKYAIVKMHAACNWAQVLEGSIDSAHSSSLHSTNMPAAEVEGSTATGSAWLRPSNDKAPRLQFEATSYGFRYAAIRRPIRNPETHQYVRTTLYIAPFTVPHPAERPVQPGADAGPDRRREHHVLLDRLASGSEEGHLAGGLAQLLRGHRRASTWTPTTGKSATCRTTTGRTAQP